MEEERMNDPLFWPAVCAAAWGLGCYAVFYGAAVLIALGAFATLLGGSSWLAERVCRAREARTARTYLVARARS